MDTKDNDARASMNDEIAAAEAALRAAQEKLDAAKAKASLDKDAPVAAAPACAAPGSAAEAVVVDTTVVASAPIELEAEPVAAAATAEPAPDWVPYSTSSEAPQGAAQSAPQDAYQPPSDQPYYAANQTQPTDQAQNSYYWQQPQQDPYANQYSQPQNPYNSVPPYQQSYYQQPYAPVVASKDHVAAGLLAIFLGSLGIHKFYLGYNTAGFIMLAVTILGGLLTLGLASAVMGVIAFIEGILYLVKSQSEFEQIYVFNQREWF